MKTGLVILTLVLFGGLFLPVNIAAGRQEQVCSRCGDDSEPEVNLTCQRARIFDPQSSYANSCDLCICPGDNPDNNPGDSTTVDLNIFGINFRLNSAHAVSQLIYLGFMFFFGVIAIATVGLGVYGAVKRSQSEDEDNIATSQKIITNAIIGFILVIVGILGAQLVASFLGVGTINEIVDLNGIFGN